MTTAKRVGRPAVPDEDRLMVGSIRLTQTQWDKFARLGGADWLRRQIRYAKLSKEQK